MGNYSEYPPVVYFSIKHARKIAKNIEKLTLDNINELIGGQIMDGQFSMLFQHIKLFQSADAYRYVSNRQEELDAEIIATDSRLRMEKETKQNQRRQDRIAAQEASAQKKNETAARVQANAKRKRSAKEAN
jgi:hypothetical protein